MTASDGVRLLRAGRILTATEELDDGWVAVRGGRIVATGTGRAGQEHTVLEHTGRPDDHAAPVAAIIVPGFVDTHVHGALGLDFANADIDGAGRIAAHHARSGTTSMLASVATGTRAGTVDALTRLRTVAASGTVAGIHLEGPFLAAGHRGAHAVELLRNPRPLAVDALLAAAGGALRSVTLAPELPGAIAAIARLTAAGVRVAIGHTDADADTTRKALDAGATIGTHLWNGMPPLHHRRPGPVGALLADSRATVELIVDGHHLHPDTVELSRQAARGRTILVSDAMAATGLGDGRYRIAGSDVVVDRGTAMLADGSSLAGSTITIADAFAAVRSAGWSLRDAVDATSTLPATIACLPTPLSPGSPADLLALDPTGTRVERVMRHGAWEDS